MSKVRVSQAALEVLWQRPTVSPTSPDTGFVGVSQAILEVLYRPTSAVRVSQAILEVLTAYADSDTNTPPSSGGGDSGGVRVFAYAG